MSHACAAPRLYVLDASVLLHDPGALARFAEHDLYVPWSTVQALAAEHYPLAEFARNAREASRILESLLDAAPAGDRVPLPAPATGTLHLLPGDGCAGDLLGTCVALAGEHPAARVVLVSKDVNLRLKARVLGVAAEDYYSDHVVEDVDLLYAGTALLPAGLVAGSDEGGADGVPRLLLDAAGLPPLHPSQCVYTEDGAIEAVVCDTAADGLVRLRPARDYRESGEALWGIHARNREQNFALNLLVDPELDLVTLIGTAGAGKTLLALAAGLAQTIEHQRYREIVVTRATIPVGDDIGFLPGSEEEKMAPWMGALMDNLEVLADVGTGGDWGRAASRDLLRNRVKLRSLNFMRGRTFLSRYLIVDEAQNLTPKQMKTLLTRAGPGTKIVCLGNIAQIDTPYLTETTSGLAYVVDRFKSWPHSGHVTLRRGERSRLADYASDTL